MRWVVGCLGLVFIVFGGCVILGGIFSVTDTYTDRSFGTGAIVVGLVILLLAVWALYKAFTIGRSPP